MWIYSPPPDWLSHDVFPDWEQSRRLDLAVVDTQFTCTKNPLPKLLFLGDNRGDGRSGLNDSGLTFRRAGLGVSGRGKAEGSVGRK